MQYLSIVLSSWPLITRKLCESLPLLKKTYLFQNVRMTLIVLMLVHLSAMPTIHVWVRNHFKTLEMVSHTAKEIRRCWNIHQCIRITVLALENACYLTGEYSSLYLPVLFNRKSLKIHQYCIWETCSPNYWQN